MMVAERAELEPVTVEIERTGSWKPTGETFAIGVRTDAPRRPVLVPIDGAAGKRVDVPASSVRELPLELSSSAALLVLPVATALRAWDRALPELGSAAVITPGPWAPLFSVVAGWYGATPMLAGGASPRGEDGDAVASLTRKLTAYPSVSAAELTGRADMVDLLLESVPKYSRVLFAGPRGDRFTIDYYVNVHRKGLHLVSAVLSALDAFKEPAGGDLVVRAARLLANPSRAARCQDAAAAMDA
jgi:threonine dehydrogenase-like Zn-dependent dehydrogenase